VWSDGAVGLGQRQSVFTPEDRFERQPLLSSGGHRVLVSDARIDNRDELARAWSVGPSTVERCPDSAFVARALDTWGDDGPSRLRGAFAFVQWDRRAGRLLLARSPLCERPLFYHSSARTFAFASMPKGLFALGLIARALDERFLADYLAFERFEPGRTFYQNVHRLPPGHVLAVTATGARAWPFWRPESHRELHLPNDEAYVGAFEELYSQVVRDALRSEGRVGLMLSGGLDSSSVAAMAAPLLSRAGRRLATFTEVPSPGFSDPIIEGRYADETPFVQSLARRYDNIDLTLIRTNGRFFLDDLDRMFEAAELPFGGPSNLVWWDALMATARNQGVRVLLTGLGGNQTISWDGFGALCQMIGRGRWRDALKEARAVSRDYGGTSVLRTLVSSGVLPWMPTPIYLAIHRLKSPRLPHASSRHPWRAWSAVRPAFEVEHRVGTRARAKGPDSRLRLRPDTRVARREFLQRIGEFSDGFFAGCEARFDLDVRDPTADTRLVEFCLSLPEDQYLRNGQSRWLIRRAMANRLPSEILDNRQRGLQAADWFARALPHQDRMLAELARFGESRLARGAIDLPRLRRLVEAMPSAPRGDVGTMRDYRGALEQGLMTGRFILWVDRSGRQSVQP
jgi:asparagine synthase (glutamine-hydrolysing)